MTTNNIKLTKSLVQYALAGMFSSSGTNDFGNGAGTSVTIVRVYKGVLPTTTEITNLTGTAFFTTRAADLLLEVSLTNLFDSVTDNTAKLKNSAYAAAAASGTATFFVLYTATNASAAINKAIVGTVTDASGNGDLKLTSADIVAGQQYRIQPMNFAIPLQFSY